MHLGWILGVSKWVGGGETGGGLQATGNGWDLGDFFVFPFLSVFLFVSFVFMVWNGFLVLFPFVYVWMLACLMSFGFTPHYV